MTDATASTTSPPSAQVRAARARTCAGVAKPVAAATTPPPAPADTAAADVIYARVSTRKQQADLDRQVAALRAAHPAAGRVLTDVCSGINFRRRGLGTLLDLAFAGRVRTVPGRVARRASHRPPAHVAHRDRLCRFAFDLIEDVLRRCGAVVAVDSHDPATSTPEGELADDLLGIVTVFGARLYGARSGRGRARQAAATATQAAEDGGRSAAARHRGRDRAGAAGRTGQPDPDQHAQLPGSDASDGGATQGAGALV